MTTLMALIVVLIIYAVIYISKKGNVDKLVCFSGKSVTKLGITKAGNCYLRRL